jgi:hypothetical protein
MVTGKIAEGTIPTPRVDSFPFTCVIDDRRKKLEAGPRFAPALATRRESSHGSRGGSNWKISS